MVVSALKFTFIGLFIGGLVISVLALSDAAILEYGESSGVINENNVNEPHVRARLSSVENGVSDHTDVSSISSRFKNTCENLISKVESGLSTLGNQVNASVLNAYRSVAYVKSIEINGNYYISDDELISWILDKGEASYNSFEISVIDAMWLFVTSRIKQNPWIEDATISWNIAPARITVNVTELRPWFVAEWEGDTWLVARNGNLISPLGLIKNKEVLFELADLPRVDGLAEVESGTSSVSSSNSRMKVAVWFLRILDAAGGMPYKVERYTLLQLGAMRVSPYEFEKYPVVLLDFDDFAKAEQALLRLKAVLSDMEARGERCSEIDLRFNAQVIVR